MPQPGRYYKHKYFRIKTSGRLVGHRFRDIWTAPVDEAINDQGYIVPSLGDVGDRMYGTR
jgi:hypothetical protein